MLELALVGIPNAGKSTFFKAVTMKHVEIADYPFTTIKPNEAVAFVTAKCVCRDFGKDCGNCVNGLRFIPVKIWDVAGLVKGAHEGRGRGNAFLDDLRQASALIHVLDISGKTDSEGNKTTEFDPAINMKILENEIDYWMLGIFKKDERVIEGRKSEFIPIVENRMSGLGVKKEHIESALKQNSLSSFSSWSEDDKFNFIKTLRTFSKPIYIAANKADSESSLQYVSALEEPYTACSAEIELALREAHENKLIKYVPGSSSFEKISDIEERKQKALDYIKQFLDKHHTTGVQETLNKTVFELLDMIVVYPVADANKLSDKKGNILPDAILIKKGSSAKDLAYAIHEDIGKTFITAVDARTGKKVGSDYELKDRDVLSIKAGKI